MERAAEHNKKGSRAPRQQAKNVEDGWVYCPDISSASFYFWPRRDGGLAFEAPSQHSLVVFPDPASSYFEWWWCATSTTTNQQQDKEETPRDRDSSWGE